MKPNQYISCTRKVAYFSQEVAEEQLSMSNIPLYPYAGYKVVPYKCFYGEHWHLGNKKIKKHGASTIGGLLAAHGK